MLAICLLPDSASCVFAGSFLCSLFGADRVGQRAMRSQPLQIKSRYRPIPPPCGIQGPEKDSCHFEKKEQLHADLGDLNLWMLVWFKIGSDLASGRCRKKGTNNKHDIDRFHKKKNKNKQQTQMANSNDPFARSDKVEPTAQGPSIWGSAS